MDDCRCADELWVALISTLKIGMSKFVLQRRNKNAKPKQKYQSKRIEKQKSIKLKHWRKLKKSNSTKIKMKYINAAKSLKSEIVSDYLQTELKVINSNDLRNFYKHVNGNSVHKTGIGPLKLPSGSLELEDEKKAQILNDYFACICATDDGVLPPIPDPAEDSSYLETITFRTSRTFRILENVKKNSPGPDGISSILQIKSSFISNP